MNNRVKGSIYLLMAAAVWGCGLVAQKSGAFHLGALAFTSIRCFIGGLSLLIVIKIVSAKARRREGADSAQTADLAAASGSQEAAKEQASGQNFDVRATRVGGVVCGIALTAGILLQQYGIAYTSVGKGGFITALYIILVPLMGILLHKKVTAANMIGAAAGVAGLYLLTMTGGIGNINKGDILMLVAAFVYTGYFHIVDKYAATADVIKMSCIQFLTVGAVCALPALMLETTTLQEVIASAVPILYSGMGSCALGHTLQMAGQKYVEPNKASLLMSMETVFTLAAGFIFFHEVLSGREYLGCLVMFAAIMISQFQNSKDGSR